MCSDTSVIRTNVAKLISVMAKTQINTNSFFKRADQDIAAAVTSIYNIYKVVLIISRVYFSCTHGLVFRCMHDKKQCRQTDQCHGNNKNNQISKVYFKRANPDIYRSSQCSQFMVMF